MISPQKPATTLMAMLLAMAVTIGFAADAKIKNLGEHLAKDQAYQKKTTFEKLKVIAELTQKNRLNYSDKSLGETVKSLVDAYMTEKGKNDPYARLKAFAELKKMTDWKQPLNRLQLDDSLCAMELTLHLDSNKDYQTGDLSRKRQILEQLIKEKMWSRYAGQYEAEVVARDYIREKTAALKGAEKALKSLELLMSMKTSGLMPWGGAYSGMEREFLFAYLSANKTYQAMKPMEKTAHLRELEKEKKVIMSFIQSELESHIVAKELLNDKAFMAADAAKKADIIEAMQKDNKIHTFSTSKIKQIFGLPRR